MKKSVHNLLLWAYLVCWWVEASTQVVTHKIESSKTTYDTLALQNVQSATYGNIIEEYYPNFSPKSKTVIDEIVDKRNLKGVSSVFLVRRYYSEISTDLKTCFSPADMLKFKKFLDIYKKTRKWDELLISIIIGIPNGVPVNIMDEVLEDMWFDDYTSKVKIDVWNGSTPLIETTFVTLSCRTDLTKRSSKDELIQKTITEHWPNKSAKN